AAADAVVRLPDLVPEGPRRLLASFAALPAAGDPPVRIPTEAGWGGSVISVPVPAGPLWYLGTIVSEESIYGPSRAALRSSLLAGLVAVVAGSVAAAFFASHLARSRRETAAQRERARRAEAAADDLGSYRLVRLLGRGGMGEVWLAEHRLLARQAAIKRIISAGGDLASAEGRQRFLQEARITASLRCRNTIELYDYGVADDGGLYFAMELLDGCDLRELVRRSGPLPVGRMVHLMVQACRSLAEAHLRGLVHRDIKPENLYACRRADEVDILKVLDFGIATVSERRAGAAGITQAGYVQGTPATMAPEQACGEQLDGRADIYALGCVMFILLTGEDPFQGSDAYGTIAAHLGEAPDAPSARSRRPLPAEVDRLVLACMAKERDGRPADAAVLAEALLALPVPDGEEWSQVRARAWWLQHVPAAPTSASGETTAAVESAR
ncbi:MAG: Serine/threonine-protein kinase PknB, partial [Planctomycetota bacterium]